MLADIGPGRARVRERRRLAVRCQHDDAALGRRDRRLRAARGLRQPGQAPTCAASSARTRSSATTSSCATATRASTSATSTGSCSTCPSRGRSCRTRGGAAPRRDPRRLHARRSSRCRSSARRWPSTAWIGSETLEVLHRGWHVEGQAVRPDHRMVAHTGFLTTARRFASLARAPDAKQRPRGAAACDDAGYA